MLKWMNRLFRRKIQAQENHKMLKVKLVPMTLMVPVIDNSGDHDLKMDEQRYAAIHGAVTEIQLLSVPRSEPPPDWDRVTFSQEAVNTGPVAINGHPVIQIVSQTDPVIDTSVRDSEMRSSAPDMSLEEFNERPVRTKTPPRPRANSWRHNE